MSASLTEVDIERVRKAVTAVVAASGPNPVLGRIAREAARLCGTPLAAVTMREAGREQLALVSVFGTGGVIAERPLPVARSLNGDVITSGRSFRSPDVWRDARVSVSDIARRNRVRSLVIVPFPACGAVAGTIAVARRIPWQFSARDEAVLQEFARNVRTPIERALTGTVLLPSSLGKHGRPDREFARSPLAMAVSESPLADQPPPVARHHLTPRECDVLRLLLADHTIRQVASMLGLSKRTVEHYVDRLKLRFGKATLHGLVTIALGRPLARIG